VPIDPSAALGAELPEREFEWQASDVLLYHLALGAGARATDVRELRYVTENDLQILPTFAVVAPTLGETDAPRVSYPGIEIDLARVLHGSQRIDVHRPIPPDGKARASTRVVDIWDKGTAAVIVTESEVRDLAGEPLWTNTSSVFARGEGGFGGDRGPAAAHEQPDRRPDVVITTSTLPQQALWYRLLGDRNPLHSDPDFAHGAGFPAPILHGLATYGIVAKALVDELLDADVSRVRAFGARFSGVVYPGETLRTAVWREPERFVVATTVADRDDAPALSAAELVVTA
jgi:acyl dehydratase